MKQKFQVTGMTCSACSATVERNVKKLEGVKEVTVNLLSNSMVVSYDEDKVNNQAIIDTVVKAGYQAALEQKNNIPNLTNRTPPKNIQGPFCLLKKYVILNNNIRNYKIYYIKG